ncbi:interleukin-36 beta [Bos indicus]|uniref:Interleukin-1 n=2 Tax=Bos TaxID=9903 RepID=A0A4W2HSJ4_BOBOX|nr:PREDICTED: interleukin-36 beta [Bos indicus]XP_027410201.1 interleukin-36 beta [Bos indicus x Bos taurus]
MACPMLREYPSYLHIRDSRQMVWVVKGNSLIAVPSSNNIKPVILSLIACRDMEFDKEGNGTPHYLGIKDKNLCLCCTEIQGYPTLQLKEESIMNLYNKPKGEKCFLFYRNDEGSTVVFQSVSYPGWFIATSSEAGHPVTLTKERGTVQSTNYYLEGGL